MAHPQRDHGGPVASTSGHVPENQPPQPHSLGKRQIKVTPKASGNLLHLDIWRRCTLLQCSEEMTTITSDTILRRRFSEQNPPSSAFNASTPKFGLQPRQPSSNPEPTDPAKRSPRQPDFTRCPPQGSQQQAIEVT
ncbi:hypothetical protein EDB85DRAFT_1898747 [Lactarius pseudohatsudake]|nr:hypothetical protein EDB85DRAFT_1898747 [Lactarius pseudohatsudake]